MKDDELALLRRAVDRGLLSRESLDRAVAEAGPSPLKWLMDRKLLSEAELRVLLEAEGGIPPRAPSGDAAWSTALLLTLIVVLGALVYLGVLAWNSMQSQSAAAETAFHQARIAQAARLALQDVQRGDFRGALDLMDAELAENPHDPHLLFARAAARKGLGDLQGALDDVEDALAVPPQLREALLLRASLWIEQGKSAAAVRELEAMAPAPDRDALLEKARKK